MKNVGIRFARVVLGTVLIGMSASTLAAWPEKPITLVVPFPPGGNTDALARLVGNHLSGTLGKPVIIENKPGAGSMIGSQSVAIAKPDGYTFLIGSIANVLNHYFYRKPLYDLTKDLAPISQLVTVPNYIAVSNNSEVKSLNDLVALAKAKPGTVSCGTTGVGTSTYLSCELFKTMANVRVTNVPYKGGMAAITDLIGGQVTFVVANEALPYIRDNRIKGLAVTTASRSLLVQELPTVSDTLPGFDVTSWYGVFAPTGTPPEIASKMSSEIAALLKLPDVQKKIEVLGAVPVGSSPDEFSSYINSELKRWETVLKPLNIRLD